MVSLSWKKGKKEILKSISSIFQKKNLLVVQRYQQRQKN